MPPQHAPVAAPSQLPQGLPDDAQLDAYFADGGGGFGDASGDAPTIFIMVASYRDFQCRETVSSALARARYPERLRVGVVQQNAVGDTPCGEPFRTCDSDPSQPLCMYAENVKIYEMDARDASGPVFARHVGYRMYRGEAFALQMDAHCVFVNNWDETLVAQWRATRNEFAVLSTYLTDVQGSISTAGDSQRKTRPIMCNSDYEGGGVARYLRHGSQPEAVAAVKGEPMLEPFWAAGFSFARGHFLVRVPYDPLLPMVFMGEEISIGIRGWTHGYDFYAPPTSVVFHEYAQESKRRVAVPKFWTGVRRALPNAQSEGGVSAAASRGDGARSLKRLTALIGMAPELMPADYETAESERYGVGHERPIELFYKARTIIPPKGSKRVGLAHSHP